MLPYFGAKFGNPSSIHFFGQAAAKGVEKAREQVAGFLNADPNEIIFTSGATESNNIAIRGLIKALKKQGVEKPHIITSMIEHSAILEPCAELQREGIEITYLKVKPNGIVDPEELKKAVRPNTALVSIMYVNNEVGSIQPIKEIGKSIRKINERREEEWKKAPVQARGERPRPIYFHTDATQALNFVNCDVESNYLDLLSLSGHKIYGPKGIGALYVRNNTPLRAIVSGGHQERNLRNGTHNTAGIVGLGAAVALLDDGSIAKNNKKISLLRDRLVRGLLKTIPDVILNTDREHATPSHAHFTFIGVEGESILIALDLAGVAVSTGSACASGSLKPSHVLLAMGIKQEVAHNSIRFTLGKNTTEAEIKRVVRVLPPIIKKLRKMRENIII